LHSLDPPARSSDARSVGIPKEPRVPPRPNAAEIAQPAGASAALPLQQDMRVYAALELDSLPGPAGPIDISWLRDGAPIDRYRVELTIDEHGIVQKLAVLDSTPSPVERQLRAAFEAARFFPARKDGRAVRSRVVLQVGASAGAAGR
jgi:periplasmic protein TonB